MRTSICLYSAYDAFSFPVWFDFSTIKTHTGCEIVNQSIRNYLAGMVERFAALANRLVDNMFRSHGRPIRSETDLPANEIEVANLRRACRKSCTTSESGVT